jgi:hypothetical protein
MYVCMICMYVCMYVCTYVCMYVCMICICVCMICMYVCMYVCMYICMYGPYIFLVCVFTTPSCIASCKPHTLHIYIHTYIHACMHTELGRTPVAVICAGAKSILDIREFYTHVYACMLPYIRPCSESVACQCTQTYVKACVHPFRCRNRHPRDQLTCLNGRNFMHVYTSSSLFSYV